MAGTITAVTKSRKGSGIVRIKATLLCDASGVATATLIGNVFGRIVAIAYAPGTLATGGDITLTDADSGASILVLTDAGTANRFFRPTTVVTSSVGVAITAATTAADVNRDVFIAGGLKVAVAQGGNLGTGHIDIIVQEG